MWWGVDSCGARSSWAADYRNGHGGIQETLATGDYRRYRELSGAEQEQVTRNQRSTMDSHTSTGAWRAPVDAARITRYRAAKISVSVSPSCSEAGLVVPTAV